MVASNEIIHKNLRRHVESVTINKAELVRFPIGLVVMMVMVMIIEGRDDRWTYACSFSKVYNAPMDNTANNKGGANVEGLNDPVCRNGRWW